MQHDGANGSEYHCRIAWQIDAFRSSVWVVEVPDLSQHVHLTHTQSTVSSLDHILRLTIWRQRICSLQFNIQIEAWSGFVNIGTCRC